MKIIVGGGISGLWLAAELKARNIPCCVIEKSALGQGQTLASQGMIHGGTKYALDGLLTKAASEIGAMPGRWKNALSGREAVDLRQVQLERTDQLLWSVESITANLLGFFASRAMRSRMERIDPAGEAAFDHPNFRGHLYRLTEPVLKLDTLIQAFSDMLEGQLFTAEVTKLTIENHVITGIETTAGSLKGDVILTAGEGTEALVSALDIERPSMQRRPLAMAVCQLKEAIPPIFGHQLGTGSKPKLTVSTHTVGDSQFLYLGGQLAEDGVEQDDLTLCDRAECAVQEALGWLEPQIQSTHVFRINRAEPSTRKGNRPDTAFVSKAHRLIIAWPTKLALAPALADRVIPLLDQDSATVSFPAWPSAQVGDYPWV